MDNISQEKLEFCNKILKKFDDRIPFTKDELFQFYYHFEDYTPKETIGKKLSKHIDCSGKIKSNNYPEEQLITLTVRFIGNNKYGQPYRYLQFEIKDIVKKNPDWNPSKNNNYFLYNVEFLSVREVFPSCIKYIKPEGRNIIDDIICGYFNIDNNVYDPFTMKNI